jgi:hypothetical protein
MTSSRMPEAHTSTLRPSYPILPFLLLISSGDMYTGVLRGGAGWGWGVRESGRCRSGDAPASLAGCQAGCRAGGCLHKHSILVLL